MQKFEKELEERLRGERLANVSTKIKGDIYEYRYNGKSLWLMKNNSTTRFEYLDKDVQKTLQNRIEKQHTLYKDEKVIRKEDKEKQYERVMQNKDLILEDEREERSTSREDIFKDEKENKNKKEETKEEEKPRKYHDQDIKEIEEKKKREEELSYEKAAVAASAAVVAGETIRKEYMYSYDEIVEKLNSEGLPIKCQETTHTLLEATECLSYNAAEKGEGMSISYENGLAISADENGMLSFSKEGEFISIDEAIEISSGISGFEQITDKLLSTEMSIDEMFFELGDAR